MTTASLEPKQLAIKVFARSGEDIPSDDFVAVFHKWIQEKRLPGMLIDVIDYGHVHHGPGVLLVTHAAHVATDRAAGRFGLLFARKRDAQGSLEQRVVTATRELFEITRLLEAEPTLHGRLAYDTSKLLISLQDRLAVPNDEATVARAQEAVTKAAGELFGSAPRRVERAFTRRDPVSFEITK